MKLKSTLRKTTELGIACTAIATLILAGCGGGGSSSSSGGSSVATTTTTVTPYKGMFTSGTVTLVDANGNAVTLSAGGTINASGVASITYPANVAYPLTVNVTGTYLNETAGGASAVIAGGSPLQGLIPSTTEAASGVPVTAVTHVARTMLPASGFSAASAVAAITGAASSVLGISSYSQAMLPPVFNAQGQTSDPTTIKLAALANVIGQQGAGADLGAKLHDIANKLAAGSAVTAVIPQASFDAALAAVNQIGGASGVVPIGAAAPTIPPITLPGAGLNAQIAASIPSCAAGQVLQYTASGLTCVSGGTVAPTPSITGFNPSTGAVGTSVTITGTNLGSFIPAPIVKFGTTTATVSSATATSITVAVPAGLAAGNSVITLSNLDGSGVVNVGTFNVTNVTAAGSFVLTLTPHAVHPSFAPSLNAAPLQVSYSTSVFCSTTPGAAASDITSSASTTTSAGIGNGQQVEMIGGTQSMNGLVGGVAVAYNTTYYCKGIAWSTASPYSTLAQTPEVSVTTIAPSLGLTWTKTRTNTAFDAGMSRLSWDGAQFIGVAGSTFATAADGITWQKKTIAAGVVFKQVIFAGGQYIAVGDSQPACVGYGCTPNPISPFIYTSPDSTTWTAQTSGLTNAKLNDVAYSGTRYVVISGTGAVTTSTDGITWTTGATGVTTGLSRIVWSGTQFVAVGANGAVVTSPDGLTWSAISLSPQPVSASTQIALNSIVWTGTQFVVVGQTLQGAPKIFTSPDASTWTERVATGGSALAGVAWTGSLFVAVGKSWATSPGSGVMTSTDGVTWTPLTNFAAAGDLSALACSASKCVVNGMSGDWVSP